MEGRILFLKTVNSSQLSRTKARKRESHSKEKQCAGVPTGGSWTLKGKERSHLKGREQDF